MYALMLASLVAAAPVEDEEKLLAGLDTDITALLRQEKDPQLVREAARLLEQTNDSDRWTNYLDAIARLRRSRAMAAVPLLLKYMYRFGPQRANRGELEEALVALTGDDVPQLLKDAATEERQAAVAHLIRAWWGLRKDKITTDPAQMSVEQRRRVVARLLQDAGQADRHERFLGDAAAGVFAKVQRVFQPSRYGEGRRTWWPGELHPALLPVLLEKAGYLPMPQPGEQDAHAVLFAAAPMLALLWNNGEAPGLDKIATDERQNSAVRLTCLLALSAAGEDLPTPTVLAILDSEKKPERRLVAILLLGHCAAEREVGPRLVALLDDSSQLIRAAAVSSLHGRCPKEALPKLKKMLEDVSEVTPVREVLSLVAAFRSREANEVLAQFLESALQGAGKRRNIYDGLSAFERATGQRWIEAGAHPETYYQARAREALDWWKKQK
jgi:hypothetical protein